MRPLSWVKQVLVGLQGIPSASDLIWSGPRTAVLSSSYFFLWVCSEYPSLSVTSPVPSQSSCRGVVHAHIWVCFAAYCLQ